MSSTSEQEMPLNPIVDGDMDSLFVLPLDILPVSEPALRVARIVKNSHLVAVVELFSDIHTGSGQVEIEHLPGLLNWSREDPPADFRLLFNVSSLPTYDVFSLRILLRRLNIAVDTDALRLSPQKNAELTEYMRSFTMPLIQAVYGDSDRSIHSFDDIVALFRDPDVDKARAKLKQLAAKLEIEVFEVPRFLEDYGDIFLSLSYYRQSFDRLRPLVQAFTHAMHDLRNNWQMRNDQNLMQTCLNIEKTITRLYEILEARFALFDRATENMWADISAASFQNVRHMIQSQHTTIGSVLCGLTVKMNAWVRLFPTSAHGGPVKRSEFIMTEMRQGMKRIRAIETDAVRSEKELQMYAPLLSLDGDDSLSALPESAKAPPPGAARPE